MELNSEVAVRLQDAYQRIRQDLVAERGVEGAWSGRLASSPLATATAISALSLSTRKDPDPECQGLIRRGLSWLLKQQNEDGGWGDTPISRSNISTTMLTLAAIELAGATEENKSTVKEGNAYVANQGGIDGLRARYGRDKTFAVPILTNAALAGQVDWSEVSPLPFELATLPQSFYRFVRMPVVSYAIPALVAVGQTIHHHRPPKNPVVRAIRNRSISRTLRVLQEMQPESGGYLEAIPLTSFVVMSLTATGQHEHSVVQKGLKFISDTAREDGSWPIDSNLATWGTSLAINALSPSGTVVAETATETADQAGDWNQLECWRWLLNCQHLERHPFTGADPGGWGWTDLSGAVPDADDTPGALLALAKLCALSEAKGEAVESSASNRAEREELVAASRTAADHGTRWLLGLQNRDGGWPTFCRGWGRLPFDRSGTDLTAHALRALLQWKEVCDAAVWKKSTDRGWEYLACTQNPDGSWLPIWFGNQSHPDETNPVYGTARVLMAYRDWDRLDSDVAKRGWQFLAQQQDSSGGWSGGSACNGYLGDCSVEETSVAVEALLAVPEKIAGRSVTEAVERGLDWLACAIEKGEHRTARPIGLYFAKLWYDELLYPLTFATSALRAAVERQNMPTDVK